MDRTASRARLAGRVILAIAFAAVLPGCRETRSTRNVKVAEFEGVADPTTGLLSLQVIPPDGVARLASLQEIPVDSSGGPGVGAADHVELVTEWAAWTDANGNSTSTPSGHSCIRPGTFCGSVTVRSFYGSLELHNAYAEITDLYPSTGHLGIAKTAVPPASVTGGTAISNANGLWAYPALLDATRGAIGGTAPGTNAANRVWYFDSLDNGAFTFHGRIWADLVTPVIDAAHPTYGTCNGAATPLNDNNANCGECNRREGGWCQYVGNGRSTQAAAMLSTVANCFSGFSPCDDTDAMMVACRDLNNDASNCGLCGRACADTESCYLGACVPKGSCPAGYTGCGTVCCPAGSTCSGSECILDDANEIAVGRDHACAVTTTTRLASPSGNVPAPIQENNVVCWGSHFYGDNTSSVGLAEPQHAGASGYYLTTAMAGLSSGDDETVGFNTLYSDALGHTNPMHWGDQMNYVDGWLSEANQLTAGGHHGCGKWSSGIYCWGDNDRGQSGNNDLAKTLCQARMECFVSDLNGHVWDGNFGLTAQQVSAGANSTCAVLAGQGDPVGCIDGTSGCFPNKGAGQTAGHVACWGDNTYGKLGRPTSGGGAVALSALALQVPGVSGATSVSVGTNHVVAVVNGDQLAFWGDNAHGQFGDGTVLSTPGTPTIVAAVGAITAASAGHDFTCYLSGGQVYCAGFNNHGQLGNHSTTDSHSFVQVPGLSGVTAISAGGVPGTGNTAYGSACALMDNKTVYCWGDNSQNQLGSGVSGGYSTDPVLVRLASHARL